MPQAVNIAKKTIYPQLLGFSRTPRADGVDWTFVTISGEAVVIQLSKEEEAQVKRDISGGIVTATEVPE